MKHLLCLALALSVSTSVLAQKAAPLEASALIDLGDTITTSLQAEEKDAQKINGELTTLVQNAMLSAKQTRAELENYSHFDYGPSLNQKVTDHWHELDSFIAALTKAQSMVKASDAKPEDIQGLLATTEEISKSLSDLEVTQTFVKSMKRKKANLTTFPQKCLDMKALGDVNQYHKVTGAIMKEFGLNKFYVSEKEIFPISSSVGTAGKGMEVVVSPTPAHMQETGWVEAKTNTVVCLGTPVAVKP